MSKFVKLKTDTYKELTKNRYYEILEEYSDPKEWYYLVRCNNMIECRLCPQEDFEKPISYVRCINNEGSVSVLTANKTYEIVSINYIGGELVALRNDVGQIGQYSSKRFEFIEKSDSVWVKLREDLHPMDLFGIHSVGSISADKIYKVESVDDSNCYKILDDNGKFIRLHNSYFIVNPTIDLCNTGSVIYTHVICKDNETVEHKLTYGGMYEIVESNDSMIKIVDDNDEYSWFAIARFETPQPQIYKLGAIAESLEPLPTTKYHITYSLQYAEGAELVDIDKANIIQIEGEIVSKGRTWVIETNNGTVIIPFKAIIHMHPQY